MSKSHAMKNQFLRPNGVENVSNMSQSVWNIIIDDQKHILDLRKSHKGRLKKSASPPLLAKNHPLEETPPQTLKFALVFQCKFHSFWLIFYRKTNTNFDHSAHFLFENQCKSHSLRPFYIGKPMQISLIRFILC